MSENLRENTATIIIDSKDEVTKKTLKFILKVLGEEFFEVIEKGPETSRPTNCSVNNGHIIQDDASVKSADQLMRKSDVLKSKELPEGRFDQQITSLSSWSDELLCSLPVLHVQRSSICVYYAGLCTVIRKMVHHVQKVDPERKAISLLGDKETCLKSYAEVSNWTQFCENDLPRSTRELCKHIQEVKAEESQSIPIGVQFILQKIEKELQTAKNIKNKHKYLGKEQKKWLTKLVNETFEGRYFQGELTDAYINSITDVLDGMWSPYLNGFEITIADLIVASMAFQIISKLSCLVDARLLEAKVPHVFRWLRQIAIVPVIKNSAENSWLSILKACYSLPDLKESNMLHWKIFTIEPVTQTKLEQKNSKIKVHHQTVISNTLANIHDAGFSAEFSDLDCVNQEIDWNGLPPALNPSKGDLNPGRALRKQKQIENLLTAIKTIAKAGHRIVDFCAGGGHVGIVLAYFLPFCEIILIENKEQSVSRAVGRIQNLALNNIRICHSNLDYFSGRFDIGVTLHACGVATDLVLNTCLRERASFVVCPCCYGGVGNIEGVTYPRSQAFRTKVPHEDYLILSHAADMTSWDQNSEKHSLATSSMALIDLDRCRYMEESGYRNELCVMKPSNCTPKNHILIGKI